MSEEYQGYTNKETWSVHQWWTSDSPGQYEYWYHQAKEQILHASTRQQVIDGIWTEAQAAKFNLADEMRGFLTDEQHIWVDSQKTCCLSELLTSAIARVNWHEVAESFLETVREDWGPGGYQVTAEDCEACEAITEADEPPLEYDEAGKVVGYQA